MVEFDDFKGGAEDAGLDDLDLDGVGLRENGLVGAGGLLDLGVGLPQRVGELAADGHPFVGFEVVVLEEEDERRGAEEGGVLPVELGLAELGGLV